MSPLLYHIMWSQGIVPLFTWLEGEYSLHFRSTSSKLTNKLLSQGKCFGKTQCDHHRENSFTHYILVSHTFGITKCIYINTPFLVGLLKQKLRDSSVAVWFSYWLDFECITVPSRRHMSTPHSWVYTRQTLPSSLNLFSVCVFVIVSPLWFIDTLWGSTRMLHKSLLLVVS